MKKTFVHKMNYNLLEKMLIDCGYDVNNINSCLVVAPNYFSQFREVGNCLVEYYNLPHSEEELEDCDYNMEEVVRDILHNIIDREFDATICITTFEDDVDYSISDKIHDYVDINKYEVIYNTDLKILYGDDHTKYITRY